MAAAASAVPTELIVAVVCPEDSPCLASLPRDVHETRFIVHNSWERFHANPYFKDVSAIVFVAAGGNVDLVPRIFDAVDVSWVHSFFAGVDMMAPFIASRLLQPQADASTSAYTSASASLPRHAILCCGAVQGVAREAYPVMEITKGTLNRGWGTMNC